MVPVKVGDVVEFAQLPPVSRGPDEKEDAQRTPSLKPLVTGKVVDVEAADDSIECVVQVSPFEPLRRVRLEDVYYKVVYEAGEMPKLTSAMIGWEIELFASTTQLPDPATIKRVDVDLNCALVAFASGQKEWLDLSMTKLKVIGRSSIEPLAASPYQRSVSMDSADTSPIEVKIDASVHQGGGQTVSSATLLVPPIQIPIPRLSMPVRAPSEQPHPHSQRRMSTAFVPICTPNVDTEEFDWYTEGGHVELCDGDGVFHEGAVLCSRTQTHVQLFNERRQFFEVSLAIQPFKVVIHGLLSLKTIPLGQAVDVYSPMTGGFRPGTVLKTAELGRLTPISFPPLKTVEWLDLSSQTFKLSFVPPASNSPEKPVSAMKSTTPTSHRSPQHSHVHRNSQWPQLHLGQHIEIFNENTRQYLKYSIAKVLDVGEHEYIFEPCTQSPSKLSAIKSAPTDLQRPVVGALPQLRCRLLLQTSYWQEYRDVLVGLRVDVYDKMSKSVASGRVLDVSAVDAEPSLLVRFKGNRNEWVYLKSSKIKARLHGREGEGTESSNALAPDVDRAAHVSTTPQSLAIGAESGSNLQLTPSCHGLREEKDSFDAEDSFPVVADTNPSTSRPELNSGRSDSSRADPTPHLRARSTVEDATSELRDHDGLVDDEPWPEYSSPHQQMEFTTNEEAGNSLQVESTFVDTKTFAESKPTQSRQRPKLNRRLSDSSSDLAPHQQYQLSTPVGGVSLSALNAQPIADLINVVAIQQVISHGHLIRNAPSDANNEVDSHGNVRLPISQALDAVQAPLEMDLWTEETDSVFGATHYVHVMTGATQQTRPTWLRRVDASSGKCFALHTSTNTMIDLPIGVSKPSGRVSARGSSSSGRFTLPVGPIEAVRAQAGT